MKKQKVKNLQPKSSISLPERTELSWKRIDASDLVLPGTSTTSEVSDNNHYDDTDGNAEQKLRRFKKADEDLEAQPFESVAIFYSLEVMDGAAASALIRKDHGGEGGAIVGPKRDAFPSIDEETTSNSNEISKRKRKQNALKNQESSSTDVLMDGPDIHTAPNVFRPLDSNVNNELSTELEEIRDIWCKECSYAVQLHNNVCRTLLQEQFRMPTAIQSSTIPATIAGQHNLVGAAPTGSGKTLSFLIPIFHTLYTMLGNLDDLLLQRPLPLQAVVVTPTRELALQIYKVGMKFTAATASAGIPNHLFMACITGGLAAAKQSRILNSQHQPPTIIVATPGRLWELMSSQQYPHLNNLSQVRFVVIDEADRMVDMTSSNGANPYKFPELIKILDAIHQANPLTEDNSIDGDDFDDSNDNDPHRMLGLPGIRGEASVQMLTDDILEQIQNQKRETLPMESATSESDAEDHDYTADQDTLDDGVFGQDSDVDEGSFVLPPVHRQTFVFSATLTLPTNVPSLKNDRHGKKRKREGHSNDALSNVHGAIADLLKKAHAVGRTKIVDLTTRGSGGQMPSNISSATSSFLKPSASIVKAPGPQQFQFPPGLLFQHIQCTQRHKDSHLYAYLLLLASPNASLKQIKTGPTIIFCNSIAAVRRVGMTLSTLRLPVRLLHAHMQQRARFKAIESLQQDALTSDCGARLIPTIVVATDVAARGLDIPSVTTVIHYDAARSVDTFIHRSGRTARGIGDGAVGCSLSLVASGEDQFHNKITKSLNVPFMNVPIDGRFLRLAQERVNLACKVAEADDTDRKKQRDQQWFIDQANQAGLEVDEDLLDNDLTEEKQGKGSTSARDKARHNEARMARLRLQELLKQPIQTQRYGKFLSTIRSKQHTIVRPVAPVVNPTPTVSREQFRSGKVQRKKKRRM